MRILVLGGAGYIGSHTVYELLDKGADVIVADNLETGHIEAVHKNARFYQGDIRDAGFVDSLLAAEQPQAAIHFAANSLVGESMTDPLKYYDNNVNGTRVLLSGMVKHGVKKIVFSSTAATYGEPERIPILESDKTLPTNAYGQTKLAMEGMFKWCDTAYDVKYVSLRYFNACGAHSGGCIGEAHSPETHLIPLVLQVPNGQRQRVSLFGEDYATPDGSCVRDYIHVTDLAQAHIQAVEYLLSGGASDTFNLGNGVGFSVKQVIAAAEKVVGQSIPVKIEGRRAGDPATLVASSQKARDILGWKPEHADLNHIIDSAWRWHKSHPHGFER